MSFGRLYLRVLGLLRADARLAVTVALAIRNASRILVFRGGRIVESGTFDELTRRGGFFAELAAAQFAPAAIGERVP